MAFDRRQFLKGTAWMGAAAFVGGCVSRGHLSGGGSMQGFAAGPIRKVRVGCVGLGMRGPGAVQRLSAIPGVEVVALCDLYAERAERWNAWLKENGKPSARVYSGEEGYKALCDSDLDLVYNTTPWQLHEPIARYAMESGKHVAIEVPAAMNLDECWSLVETSERTRRHCMQLENCCYGEIEMLTLNLVRLGKLGELVHAEGAYIHDLREGIYKSPEEGSYQGYWRLKWNVEHSGNIYPTHGLVPLMQAMDINRGDRFDYLTSVNSAQIGMLAYAREKFGPDSWQAREIPKSGDMSTTVIKTVKGKTIMVQHDVTSARPYSRINLVSGTQGILNDYPFRVAFAEKPGDPVHEWFGEERKNEVLEKYKHPLWKVAGEIAQKVGGHGGMDFLMDLRLAYCLQNGLPLDMDVYDLASSCSLCELCERSSDNRGASQDVPDFTGGTWRTTPPLGIESVDLSKMGLDAGDVGESSAQLNV
ncbi:MAG: Gfo/Idh/MocA family oxidoreductase [Kiritimatiellae bacterium]|nr:Gfo/Idh/MocA family oxidoreductase [Kiritimatiellia bacterium]